MDWLAGRQSDDGSWRENGEDVTGLVVLAFTGAGYSHLTRKYGSLLCKGLAWILSRQRDDGRIADGDVAAAFALVEEYSNTGSFLLADAARRAVESVSRRWEPGEWAVQMRRAAVLAGFEMPWRDRIENDTARRVVFRLFFDRDRGDPGVSAAAEEWIQHLPRREQPDFSRWHHVSLALYLSDGPKGSRWTRWEEALKKALLPLQRADGSWSGSVRDTALNAMTLEMYYRFVWVFGRKQ